MTYLLDTNAVIALLKNHPNAVRKQLRRAAAKGASISVSSVVLFELWFGASRSERRRENTERLRVFLSGTIGVVSFDEEDAMHAGDLRAALEAGGTPLDTWMITASLIRVDGSL